MKLTVLKALFLVGCMLVYLNEFVGTTGAEGLLWDRRQVMHPRLANTLRAQPDTRQRRLPWRVSNAIKFSLLYASVYVVISGLHADDCLKRFLSVCVVLLVCQVHVDLTIPKEPGAGRQQLHRDGDLSIWCVASNSNLCFCE